MAVVSPHPSPAQLPGKGPDRVETASPDALSIDSSLGLRTTERAVISCDNLVTIGKARLDPQASGGSTLLSESN